MTVGDLKLCIRQVEGIPPENQHLMLKGGDTAVTGKLECGIPLSDNNKALSDFDVKDGAWIHVTIIGLRPLPKPKTERKLRQLTDLVVSAKNFFVTSDEDTCCLDPLDFGCEEVDRKIWLRARLTINF